MSSESANDAVVVGAGPNGLVAAITLAQAGWRVHVMEAASEPGGGTRSAELTLPGVIHDVCSAIHPLGLASAALRALPLADHGLSWVHPDVPVAHPLDGGRVALLHRSVAETADGLGADGGAYRRMMAPLVDQGLVDSLLAPFGVPRAPILLARYGLTGIRSAVGVGRSKFDTPEARGLFAGLAGHSILSLNAPSTAGYGLMLGMLGHLVGWPMAQGGSRSIATALVSVLESLGGTVECNRPITNLDELPAARATLLDLTPRQVIAIAGDRLPSGYRSRLERFRYGPGVWKVDWRSTDRHRGPTPGADGPRPCTWARHWRRSQRPRTTSNGAGTHTAWAYCHVPNGSTVDMTARIEAQVERFAPGFRDRIIGRHVMGPAAMESHDGNYIGGDINGGMADLRQFVGRPVLSPVPWRTPVDGLYLCSSSTPPGGGVHGMCGHHAARAVLRKEGRPA